MNFDAAPTDLSGKKCIVTGANGGIGCSIVKHFAELGATVYATDLGERSNDLDCHEYQSFNLLDNDGLENCCSWVKSINADVLVNNAALFDMGSVLDADLEQYDRLFGLNVRALFAIMQSSANSMLDNKISGSIVNLASQAGHRGEALVAHYCATKAAVISYTQSAALALAPHGIRVNALSPGVINTPMWETVDALFAHHENKKPGQKKQEVGDAVPLGYMGEPYEVARVAVFLATEQSRYITAQTISVDGGNVLR